MIESLGECNVQTMDDANVPVDIWFKSPDCDYNKHPGKWTLTAGNYMPRKGRVSQEAYCFVADTQEELSALVEEHIIPLYLAAINILQRMATGKPTSLYYWSQPHEEAHS